MGTDQIKAVLLRKIALSFPALRDGRLKFARVWTAKPTSLTAPFRSNIGPRSLPPRHLGFPDFSFAGKNRSNRLILLPMKR